MCRGCELGNVEEYLIYHQVYKDAIQSMKAAEFKLLCLKHNTQDNWNSKKVDAHHKRLVKIRKAYGKADEEFKL